MTQGPARVIAENLAPWLWKKERAPKLYNPGPDTQMSVNRVQAGPLLEDAKPSIAVSTDCLQSQPRELAPASMESRVMDSREARVLEDGK